MKLLRESMTRMHERGFTIRIWREESLAGSFDRRQLVDEVRAMIEKGSPEDWAKRIIALPNVNAVEVINIHGGGEVLYKDWP